MAKALHWYREHPMGRESGPFTDDERADLDATARRPITWRTETLHTCERCGATFYYAPSAHRCPGGWEAIAGPAPVDPFAGMTWADECVAKVMEPKR